MNRKINLIAVMFILATVFVQCSKEDTDMMEKGQIAIKITDAPSDDANIEGTFITIADVKVDGQSIEGFQKQTIEISAYQNGETMLLINKELEAKSYNSISIVLDNETDASGNSPGCYVLTSDNKKNNLMTGASAESEITFSQSVDVETNSMTSLVIDFDLRKMIVRNTENQEESEYKFVTSAEMTNAVRMVHEENTGEINGKVNTTINSDDNIYIFIYEKGSYNETTESQGQGSSNVLFANAVTSAKVESNGNYTLSFIEEGNYEIHVVAYEKQTENKWMFKGELNASSTISGLILNNLNIESDSQIELNINVLNTL